MKLLKGELKSVDEYGNKIYNTNHKKITIFEFNIEDGRYCFPTIRTNIVCIELAINAKMMNIIFGKNTRKFRKDIMNIYSEYKLYKKIKYDDKFLKKQTLWKQRKN
jgi:hypothetical protein